MFLFPLDTTRAFIDIKATATKHPVLARYVLQFHGLTGDDQIPALFNVGKKKALNTLTCYTNESPKGKSKTGFFNPEILGPVGDINADVNDILAAGSQFLIGCYGKNYAKSCSTMTEARIKVWRKKIQTGPVKLRYIPPTNESSGENIKRAHLQVAHWKTAITGVPPKLDPNAWGYDSLNTA